MFEFKKHENTPSSVYGRVLLSEAVKKYFTHDNEKTLHRTQILNCICEKENISLETCQRLHVGNMLGNILHKVAQPNGRGYWKMTVT